MPLPTAFLRVLFILCTSWLLSSCDIRQPERPNIVVLDADYTKNLPLEEVTIAEALKPFGYTSAAIGKWHVSWDEGYYPEQQGFDFNIGGNKMGNPGDYFCPYDGKWRMTPEHPYVEWNVLPECRDNEYLTDRLTTEAENFIESLALSQLHRNRSSGPYGSLQA